MAVALTTIDAARSILMDLHADLVAVRSKLDAIDADLHLIRSAVEDVDSLLDELAREADHA